MGEVSEMILGGMLCEGCGVYMGEGDGIPQRCRPCGGVDQNDMVPNGFDQELEQLERRGYRVELKNNGYHWIVTKTVRADYWPTKAKYRMNNTGAVKFGFDAMLAEIKKL